MRALVLSVTLLAFAAGATQDPKNADLEKAQKALAAKKYPDALKLIDAAETKGGLDFESYSTLLESKALALASTRRLKEAEDELKKLLALDPRRDLAGKYQGDVVKALDAALAWVNQHGGNQLVALEPEASGGKITKVSVRVKGDPLAMVKSVRFNLKDASGWRPVEAALANGVASADVDVAEVEFWAEALDEKKNQVELLGSAIRPIAQAAPPVVVEKLKPAPAPVAAAAPTKEQQAELTPAEKPEEPSLTEEPRKSSPLRGVSYATLGAGVIAAGIGVYFGASSTGARSQILIDQMAGTFSQQVLYDRDQGAIGQAKIANGMFVTAAVLAVIGVMLFVLSG